MPEHDRPLPGNLLATVQQARALFRTKRNPAADPYYQHLRPGLVEAKRRLAARIDANEHDEEAAGLLAEVIHYLPVHPQ